MLLLTFRQVATLWERYWDRTMWHLTQQAKLGGLGGLLGSGSSTGSSEARDTTKTIDATTEDGIMELVGKGLPIKFIPAQQG